jgi:hypothetical protein
MNKAKAIETILQYLHDFLKQHQQGYSTWGKGGSS